MLEDRAEQVKELAEHLEISTDETIESETPMYKFDFEGRRKFLTKSDLANSKLMALFDRAANGEDALYLDENLKNIALVKLLGRLNVKYHMSIWESLSFEDRQIIYNKWAEVEKFENEMQSLADLSKKEKLAQDFYAFCWDTYKVIPNFKTMLLKKVSAAEFEVARKEYWVEFFINKKSRAADAIGYYQWMLRKTQKLLEDIQMFETQLSTVDANTIMKFCKQRIRLPSTYQINYEKAQQWKEEKRSKQEESK